MTFIRCFGGAILDILECAVQQDTARTLSQFGGAKCRVGVKPLLSFSGTQFEDPVGGGGEGKFAVAKSMFLDFFRGGEAKEVDVEGLQWMINFSAAEEEGEEGTREMVYMRCWRLVTKRSGQKLPRVEIEEMGPRIDFRLGRVRDADEGALRDAMRRSKGTEVSFDDCVERVSTDKATCFRRGRRRTLKQISWATKWDGYTSAVRIWMIYKLGR